MYWFMQEDNPDAVPRQPRKSLQQVCQEAVAWSQQRALDVRLDRIGEYQFFFGICTDVQWAEIPNLLVHDGTTRCALLSSAALAMFCLVQRI